MVLLKRNASNNKLLFRGKVERYICATDLSGGEPVCYTIDSSNNFLMDKINSSHTNESYLGICINDVVVNRDTLNNVIVDKDVSGVMWGNVLRKGIIYANTQDISYNTTETVELDDLTNDSTKNNFIYIKFTDSGGISNAYTANENYSITFDAGVGNTFDLIFNDFSFHHSNQIRLNDRLSLEESDNGTSWANVNISWFNRNSNSAPNEFPNTGDWNDSTSINGWIVPKNVPRAILLSSGTFPVTEPIAKRYIKFNFISDTGTQNIGWDIDIRTSVYPGNLTPDPINLGTKMFIGENSKLNKSSSRSGYNLTKNLGEVIDPKISNGKIKIYFKK